MATPERIMRFFNILYQRSKDIERVRASIAKMRERVNPGRNFSPFQLTEVEDTESWRGFLADPRAGGFWAKTYGRKVKRWPAPSGKDPTEAFQSGIDLREWIAAGLEYTA